jgi:hypothetical protein
MSGAPAESEQARAQTYGEAEARDRHRNSHHVSRQQEGTPAGGQTDPQGGEGREPQAGEAKGR